MWPWPRAQVGGCGEGAVGRQGLESLVCVVTEHQACSTPGLYRPTSLFPTDAALVCALLVIYTDLLEWNTAGAAFGMN